MQAMGSAQSEELISVKTALSPMWHQSKQLVILLSHRQNSSLMDWFFTFQPARVGMSPGWCLPSMWAGWGPALLVWCWQQPHVPTGPRGAWLGLGQQRAKFGKLITGMGLGMCQFPNLKSLSVSQVYPLIQSRITGL